MTAGELLLHLSLSISVYPPNLARPAAEKRAVLFFAVVAFITCRLHQKHLPAPISPFREGVFTEPVIRYLWIESL